MKITDAPTQRQFRTSSAEDVVSSALAADFPVRFSCREGFCGQCRGEVLAGRYRSGRDGEPREVAPGARAEPVLLCQTYPQADLLLRVPRAGDTASGVRAARIESIELAAADIAVVRFTLLDGEPLRYEAGQFMAIRWSAAGYKPFSLARACEGGASFEIHVRKMAGGEFTEWLFAEDGRRAVGAILGVEGPLGEFGWQTPPDRPAVLVATGTGFAPLEAMIEAHRLWERASPVHLYIGARTAADLYADARCRAWAAAPGQAGLRYVPVLSGESREGMRSGRVDAAVMADFPSLAQVDVYACGAPAMVEAARAGFVGARGLPAGRFFADPFAPPRPSSARRDTLLRMNLRLPDGRQGHLMAVQGRPLLGELMRAGIALQHLCGGHAVCATCAVEIQAGADAPPPAEDEAELLDFLGAAPGTRLACQLQLAAGFEHAQVSLPRGLLLDGPQMEAAR